MQPQKEVIPDNMEIDPRSPEFDLIIEFTSLMHEICTTGEDRESGERCRELQEQLKAKGIIIDCREFAPGEPSFTINRLH